MADIRKVHQQRVEPWKGVFGMKRTMVIAGVLLGVVVLATASTGCAAGMSAVRRVALDRTSDKTNKMSREFALEGAARVSAEIVMGVGDLDLSGDTSSTKALTADLVFSPESLRPMADYALDDDEGRIEVRQPGYSSLSLPAPESVWDLKLNGTVPTDLALDLGLVRSDIDLRSIDVRNLSLENGVGDSTIDLTGPRSNGVVAHIQSEAGKVTVRLSKDVPVIVRTEPGQPGRFRAPGFVREGESWVNEAWKAGQRGPAIDISVETGIGEVKLVLVE